MLPTLPELSREIFSTLLKVGSEHHLNKLLFAYGITEGYNLGESGCIVGSLEMVQMYEGELTLEMMNLCAKHGHLDVLKWAIDNGCPPN